jgi:hypothetical protein
MGEGLTDEEILAWMRAHAAEHTIRGMVLAGEMVEHYQRHRRPQGRGSARPARHAGAR